MISTSAAAQARAQQQPAGAGLLLLQGVLGVDDEIGEHLMQLVGVAQTGGRPGSAS